MRPCRKKCSVFNGFCSCSHTSVSLCGTITDTAVDTMRILIGVQFLYAKVPIYKGFRTLFNDNRLYSEVVSRFMRKFDSGIWQKSITTGCFSAHWLRLSGRGAKGQGRAAWLALDPSRTDCCLSDQQVLLNDLEDNVQHMESGNRDHKYYDYIHIRFKPQRK